jgi:hypothetical protein
MTRYSYRTVWVCPLLSMLCLAPVLSRTAESQGTEIRIPGSHKTLKLYPHFYAQKPDLPSPFATEAGVEVVTTCTADGRYALMPATVTLGGRVAPWNQPLEVDREDFPTLARTGLHSEIELDMTRAITGRSVAEVTELGWPGRLSTNGFMCEDKDVISVLKGDDRLVGGLGLTHAAMARPLLHVCNICR